MIEDSPRIRARREELGMSQYALAKAVQKSQSHVARIEAGEIPNPGVSIALAMAAALKTNVEDLFGNTDGVISEVLSGASTEGA